MKHCKQCGAHKSESDFYPKRSSCKDCVKANVRANYSVNRDQYREYERRRASLPHRIEARESYAATDEGRKRSTLAKRAYIERNGDKRHAHNLVESAVKRGKLWKSPCCTSPGCFSTENIQGHHTHYNEPLCVVWLCSACHAELHREHDSRQWAAA